MKKAILYATSGMLLVLAGYFLHYLLDDPEPPVEVVIEIQKIPPSPPPKYTAPMMAYRVTSPQGPRVSPFTDQHMIHYGVDMSVLHYDVPEQYNVYAIADGVVINHWLPPGSVSYRDGKKYVHNGHPVWGAMVEIQHAEGISRYAHLEDTMVFEGMEIRQGQQIGVMGDTGLSRGKHLHFEFFGGEVWN